jgi:hypothetical protein
MAEHSDLEVDLQAFIREVPGSNLGGVKAILVENFMVFSVPRGKLRDNILFRL